MKPVVLAILDGVGLRDEIHGNAFKQALKPNYDFLINEYPHCKIKASGLDVGLPANQMGNSEVGHMNIGAGRIVYQPLEFINNAIEDNSFYQNKTLLSIINHVKENNSNLHILGLISDGGVHSHINHVIALLKLAKMNNISKVYIHCFTDGRDTLANKALYYLDILNKAIVSIGIGTIATISGRYYAMDRDRRWERIKLAYDAMVYGVGPKENNIEKIVSDSFSKGIFDEFMIPTIVNEEGLINDNDGIIVANYRPERLIQLCTALTNNTFNEFDTKKLVNIKLATMMPTSDSVIGINAFEHAIINNTLGEYLEAKSLKQLRIAETEKYQHVTFFFDGGKDLELSGCKKILIHSPKVPKYDMTPRMSADELTQNLLKELDNNYDFVLLNYANCDIVGHTGNMEAVIKAVEAVDENLGLIYHKVKEIGGLLIVTADHGNCEYMLDDNNNAITSHTSNQVPFIICDKNVTLKDGRLCDIAPTVLKIMGYEIPSDMTGDILI